MTFPVLICIPHSGTKIPTELKSKIKIKSKEVFADIDAYTKEIYDIGSSAMKVISTPYARTFIDVNRNENDLPPNQPDGIVKSMTCYKDPIYKLASEPDSKLLQKLIKKYYEPYHTQILGVTKFLDLKLALDCHSMAAVAPDISPDVGQERPLICLGNCFGKSCSTEMTERLAECFRLAFGLSSNAIKINEPFFGKYTTQKYGNKPVPWVHVELNRRLFLEKPWFDSRTLKIDKKRLLKLNYMFEMALRLFFDNAKL
ncbi:MAG: N-formylglutamate amidohydrolase [Nitrosopumilaceae archaeon]